VSTLILVPTAHEAGLLPETGTDVAVCGFGLAVAGAGAAYAIARHHASRVILVGCGGSYDLERTPIGSAVVASAVRCDGIGAGGHSAAELGWVESDQIELGDGDGLVLSVAAASATPEEARIRLGNNPQAVVEEMEGYAVAVAATLWEVPLAVVRGVSNAAGDRDMSTWRIGDALAAAGEVVTSMLAR
jgi:futalosine hydrolase